MVLVGFSKSEFTPIMPVPLAGYAHLSDRMSRKVRDPLFVRAVAISDGNTTVILIIYDLLLIWDTLYEGLKVRLSDTKAHVICHATHTHSSIGGFIDSFLGRRFMGDFRDWVIPMLVDVGERVARESLASMKIGMLSAGVTRVHGLNENRRDPNGPKDDEVTILMIKRNNEQAIILSYSAHPVIVAERDHFAVSADYPGEVARRLENKVQFSAFIQGSLGGVGCLFPNDVDLEKNIEMMASPLVEAGLTANLEPCDGNILFKSVDVSFPSCDVRPFFDDQIFRHIDLPIRFICNRLVGKRPKTAMVEGFRVGNFALIGTPADLGVGIAIEAKNRCRKAGIPYPIIASQTNGYIGYIHRRSDYAKSVANSHLAMAIYENSMSFFGRNAGEMVLEAISKVIEGLVSEV